MGEWDNTNDDKSIVKADLPDVELHFSGSIYWSRMVDKLLYVLSLCLCTSMHSVEV